MIVYVLYFVSYFFILTSVVGVIIAYVQIGSADPMLQSHYRFQIQDVLDRSSSISWSGVVLCFSC